MPLFARRSSNSKEEHAAPGPASPLTPTNPTRVSSQEADAINDLLKATSNGEYTGPFRERRLSNGNIDPLKKKEKEISPELKAINDLIKEAHSEGTQAVLRQRRRSKEIPGDDQGVSDRPVGTPSAPSAAPSDRPSTRPSNREDDKSSGDTELATINRRISEDRRVRRASKELQESQLAAVSRSIALEKELEQAEKNAEEGGLAAPKAVSEAVARGTAKAAAAKADGFFIPRTEYLGLQSRLNSLEAELSQLKEERKESHSLFHSIALRFHRADSKSAESSPAGKRDADSLGQSYVRRLLETNGDSFVKRLARPSSPVALRRQASKGRFKELGKTGRSPSSTNVLMAAAAPVVVN